MPVVTGYEIGEELGEGGMGIVYAGRHLGLDRPVAIKFLKEALAADREFRERFLREARLSARLQHPNVVRIYDTGEQDDRPYLVMELLDGESLRVRLKRGALPVEEAVAIADALLAALGAAHAQGIIHRDVKPGNIFLRRDGTVALLDFGIARALAESRLTATGAPLGTAEYMAPEQVNGAPVDGRSDLYAVGVVLVEMLTGEAPFQADTPVAVLYQHLHAPPPRLSGAPAWLDALVQWALAKNPAERFAGAEEMRAALRQNSAATAPAPQPPARRAAAAVAVAGLVIVIGVGLSNQRPPTAPTATGGTGALSTAGPAPAERTTVEETSQKTSGEAREKPPAETKEKPSATTGAGETASTRPLEKEHPSSAADTGKSDPREPERLEGERFPETRTRRLTTAEVEAWSAEDLRYAINEMHARHGYDFKKPEVRRLFTGHDWYHREPGRKSAWPYLNRDERANYALMGRVRNRRAHQPVYDGEYAHGE